ncbi:hypothetical protein LOK49_LG02G03287 [Camellia lanceoleosa]|uniref:Uncharacterized protein n=1 Tax=Camellia lanceoleosa TaxID=1840588 RepID=A0ACC0IKE5_9ERIC|nr:hypothetical protein LOK49_LG02G03287 [Camellia lanceoleosa]
MENKNKGGKKSKLVRLNNSQLSFLKHRFSLFKKANELSTRCGIEVAVMLVLQRNPRIDELRLGTARKNEALFGASIEELSLEQLKELKAKLMEVREKVTNKLVELLKEANGGGGFEMAHGF